VFKHYFTFREGWFGDYVHIPQAALTRVLLMDLISGLFLPAHTKHLASQSEVQSLQTPFYGLNESVPIHLTLILGLQHAHIMIGSIVSPSLAIAGGAFCFDLAQTQYLVSVASITTRIATALQVSRVRLTKTPFFIGTGLLSVVGSTFDILPIAFNYTSMRYANGTCPVAANGTKLACLEA
jgi:xanthine/uracil permease